MSFETPNWGNGNNMPPQIPQHKMVQIDVGELIRTRDALTSAYLNLSGSLDRAVKAYLDHTQVVLNGDATLNVSHLLQPFNVLTNHAQMAQAALSQQNGGPPVMFGTQLVEDQPADPKKRKKRAYKPRDPNAPKRPLTAYFRYLQEQRPLIQKEITENPEAFEKSGKPGDISKIATERWKELGYDNQEPYREAYQAALKDHEAAMAEYKKQGGQVDDAALKDLDADAPGEEEAEADAAAEQDDEDDDDDDDDDDTESEDEKPAPPPPPPEKTPKKSALKKSKSDAKAAPQTFNSINPVIPAAAPVAAPASESLKSSSPTRKRKGDAEADAGDSRKKKGRKSGAVVAGADSSPAPAPVAPRASSPEAVPASDPVVKKKKDKKRKKGGE